MWDIEHFPGAGNVPWPLLIRARTIREIDAVLASIVVRHVADVASPEVTRAVAKATHRAVAEAPHEDAAPEQRLAALSAALGWDDWCGTPWPHRWPGPRPRLEDYSDPITTVVIEQAVQLFGAAGSKALAASLDALAAREGVLVG